MSYRQSWTMSRCFIIGLACRPSGMRSFVVLRGKVDLDKARISGARVAQHAGLAAASILIIASGRDIVIGSSKPRNCCWCRPEEKGGRANTMGASRHGSCHNSYTRVANPDTAPATVLAWRFRLWQTLPRIYTEPEKTVSDALSYGL